MGNNTNDNRNESIHLPKSIFRGIPGIQILILIFSFLIFRQMGKYNGFVNKVIIHYYIDESYKMTQNLVCK